VPSWSSVIVGAVVVGALIGAAQQDGAPDEPPVAEQPVAEQPVVDPPVVEVDQVLSTLPPDGSARIALTFDDGPHPQWTPQVLDVLARHDAVATFCVVGEQVTGRDQLLRRIHAEGHALCNHTTSHDYGLPVRDPAEIRAQIAETTDVIVAAVPEASVSAFRAPGGRFDRTVVAQAQALGLDSWAWSVDSRDWDTTDPDEIVTRVLDGVGPDAVVLLHDGGGDRAATVAALDELLPVLASVGYQFVTLPDVS
jgi:peptidoglycan/xylan/chitin deacetylase (PgdA/CDA1 family)